MQGATLTVYYRILSKGLQNVRGVNETGGLSAPSALRQCAMGVTG